MLSKYGIDIGGLGGMPSALDNACRWGHANHPLPGPFVDHVHTTRLDTIGDDVWAGPYVYITDQNHGYEDPDAPIGRQFPENHPVSIGAGSWLGAGAIILPGTAIGRNVVVAAGSVVRGVVPDRCVVAGVPAKVVREHTADGWQSPRARADG